MGRILLSICAVVVAMGLAGASGPNEARGKDQAAAQQTARPGAPLPVIPPHAHTEPEDTGCEDGQDRRQSDLCAQWKAADAARSAADASWRLGAIGTILGSLTLLAAWRAAHWAKQAAKHTEDGAKAGWAAEKVTRESAEQQLRAYVGPNAAQYTLSVLPTGGVIGVSVEFQNFGQTPAYQYRTAMGLARRPFPLTETHDFEASGDTHTLFPSMKSYATLGMSLSPADLAQLQQGLICLVVTAVAEYRDLNDDPRASSIRYLIHSAAPNMHFETHTGTLTFYSGAST